MRGPLSLSIPPFLSASILLILYLEVCRVLKSLCHDSKEIPKPAVFVQPVTLSALSLNEPFRTIDHDHERIDKK